MRADILGPARDRSPASAALQHGEVDLTYGRLADDVDRVAACLFEAGIAPGDIVATDIRKPVSHWVVLLALLRLGAVSVSLTSNAPREIASLPGSMKIVTGPNGAEHPPTGLKEIRISADWLNHPVPDGAQLPDPADAQRKFGRICFSSGTTGRPKAFLLDAARLSARLAATGWRTRIDGGTVLWPGLGPDTAYGYTATVAALLAGGTVVLSHGGPGSWTQMHRRRVNLLLASPAALKPLLRDAEASGLPPAEGQALVAGGRLSPALRDAVAERLCPRVFIAFGSSEAGGITFADARSLDADPGYAGAVFPDVAAEIVDENDTTVQPGTAGRLRVRTDSLPDGYLDDPAATLRHFKDGWFYSGDIARLETDRTLTVVGRAANLLNIGGVKVSTDELELAVQDQDTVQDAFAFLVPAGDSGAELAIAVVASSGAVTGLGARLRSLMPQLPRFQLLSVPSIPRGSMGKIDRAAFAESLDRARQARSPEIRELGVF